MVRKRRPQLSTETFGYMFMFLTTVLLEGWFLDGQPFARVLYFETQN